MKDSAWRGYQGVGGIPVLTYAIIVTNALVFLLTGGSVLRSINYGMTVRYGIIPLVTLAKPLTVLSPESQIVGEYMAALRLFPLIEQNGGFVTLLTYLFLHGEVFHLFSNMYILLVFGIDCEDALRKEGFLTLYFGSGILAGIFHSLYTYLLNPERMLTPTIGASGAIFGILAAYAILFPLKRLNVLVGFVPVDAPAVVVILAYAILETIYATLSPGYVAHSAHVGGFIVGAMISLILRARGLVDRKSRVGDISSQTIPGSESSCLKQACELKGEEKQPATPSTLKGC